MTAVERGTVNSQSDGDWASFSTLEEADTEYDAHQRPVVQRLASGGTTYQLTQTSYDSVGRANCVAQRMNPSEFATASLPVDACTLDSQGTGANDFGPDRITRTSFDKAGRPNLVQTGYLSSVQADDVATTYTSNGQVATVTDAEGNMTTYEYDGHDRLLNTRYPSPTTDGASAPTSGTGHDYEQLSYDAVGNVTSQLLRDGTSIGFTYDHLGRLIERDLPGSEATVDYAYDLLGQMTSASQPSLSHTLTFTYDALGRTLSEAGLMGTFSYGYDSASRPVSMTYPGSTTLVVGYNYDDAGDLTTITENPGGSAVTLATYAYDNRGRRTSLTRGNGAVTSYAFDNVSRPTQIAEDFTGGTSYDRTLDIARTPAGQIASTTGSNDAYAWAGHYAVNRGYTANGLNQYTAAGAITPTYDTRGNLTAAGGGSYDYYAENRLAHGPGSAAFVYDPLGRLFFSNSTATGITYLASAGDNVGAEFNSGGTMLRRYVWGPGTDEPLVWFEGTGLSTPHYYHTDERGSVIALSNGSGALTDINTYDEYGIPGSSNAGRFQYTGQQWLAEVGMYHYRNRTYSPTLGRFLQTDPVGFDGGMNIYAYTGNDPANLTDPLGLDPPDDPPRTHCVDMCLTGSGVLVAGYASWWGPRLSSEVICGRASRNPDDPCYSFLYVGFGFLMRELYLPYAPGHNPFDRTIVDAVGEVQAVVRTIACAGLYYLPEGSRIRLGADAGAGHGDALTGGGGVSLHRDGSLNWDHYYGSGQGGGGILGIGLGWDMNAHQPGWSHTNGEYGIAAGYRAGGGNISYSRSGGVGVGGGVSAGPRFGLLLTHVNTNTYTRQLSAPVCLHNN